MKINRSYFLSGTTLVLAGVMFGCSGNYGGTPDSTFSGSYRSAYNIPSLSEVGNFSYSVNQKGLLEGSLIDVSTNKVMAVTGTVKNNGTFSGEVKDGSSKYPISGTLDKNGGDFKIAKGGSDQRGNFTVGASVTEQGNSQYQGIYAGVYSVPGINQGGLTSYTIDSKGNITGSIQKGSETGLLVGTISNTGAFKANARFSTGSQPLEGTIVKTGDGSSQGNFVLTQGTTSYPATFSKSETAQAGKSSIYNGSYRGTYGMPERGESGTVSFTIDPSGSILGFFSQSANQPVATFTGTIQNDGGFAGNLSYPNNTPATRPIVGKIAATTSGSGTQAGDFTLTIGGVNVPGNFQLTIGGSEVDSDFRGSYGNSNIVDGLLASGTPTPSWALGLDTDTNTYLVQAAYTPAAPATVPPATPAPAPTPVPAVYETHTVVTMSVSVDKQGRVIGTLGGRALDATITNDGRITGIWSGNRFRGIVSHQKISVLQQGSDGKLTVVALDGMAGDLVITISGVDYAANIAGVGGNKKSS
jgi:hypothetical protein